MATVDEIAAFRLLIGETDETTYSDAVLSERLDAATSMDALAYQIWTEKAAAAANLVDVTEGGSSRKMGDIYEQALAMAETYRQRALAPSTPPSNSTGVRVRRLARP